MADTPEYEADLTTPEGRVAYLCALVDRIRTQPTMSRDEAGHYDAVRKLLSTAHRWHKEAVDEERLDRIEQALAEIQQAQAETSEVIPPEYQAQDSTEAGDAD